MMWLRQIYYLLRLARPLFLAGGFVFLGLGAAVALSQGHTAPWPVYLWGQAAVTAGQLMTHFSNDYFDLAADRLYVNRPSRWSGGSRVLADGLLPPRAALIVAIGMALVALAATAVLALVFRQPVWPIGLLLAALFLAWEYSAPPLRLNARGWGELAAALIVPVLTPLTGYALLAGRPGALPLLAVWPLACHQAAMILVINCPDAPSDRAAGKMTLVARLGERRAARFYPLLPALAYGALPPLVDWGLPPLAAAAVLLPLPLSMWLTWRMVAFARGRPVGWNGLAFWSIGLLMSTAGLELAAFLFLALR